MSLCAVSLHMLCQPIYDHHKYAPQTDLYSPLVNIKYVVYNILLLHFQTTKICNTCAFYMHIVVKWLEHLM